jgi:rhomboid protease GluP|nr:rhomboid family intramembrane serine protease [Kofleriaceae bacterium]
MATSTSAPAIAIGFREPEPGVPWLTYFLLAVNLVAFAVEVSVGAGVETADARTLVAIGANFPPLTLHGEPWRLATAMFLHAGVVHLALNMIFLFQVRTIERMMGRSRFAAIYVAGGLCGGVATLLFGHAAAASVGASGALFGVVGAYLAWFVVRRKRMDAETFAAGMKWVAGFVVLNAVYAVATPRIDLSAHAGGLVAGFVLGAWLAAASPGRGACVRAAIAAAIGIAIATTAVVALPAPTLERVYAWMGRAGELAGELATLDHATATTFDGLHVPPGELAAAVERDVVPPVRAFRAEVVAARGEVPEAHRALLDAIVRVLDAKLAWYGDLTDPARRYLAAGDAKAKREALMDVARELDAVAHSEAERQQ